MVMVQPSLHGHMTLVNGVEMPASAAQLLPAAEANHFLMNVQVLACHLVARVAIGDTNAVFGEPV